MFDLIAAAVITFADLAPADGADVYDREMCYEQDDEQGPMVSCPSPRIINLTAIHDIDSIPACVMEDGSDIIPAIADRCIWTNDGNAWLTYENHSLLIVDDITVR